MIRNHFSGPTLILRDSPELFVTMEAVQSAYPDKRALIEELEDLAVATLWSSPDERARIAKVIRGGEAVTARRALGACLSIEPINPAEEYRKAMAARLLGESAAGASLETKPVYTPVDRAVITLHTTNNQVPPPVDSTAELVYIFAAR